MSILTGFVLVALSAAFVGFALGAYSCKRVYVTECFPVETSHR
jgi:hypothetical protein